VSPGNSNKLQMANIILNADLGEGEDYQLTRRLMTVIGAANIATGGHAGSKKSIRQCLEACAAHGVKPGAHPGMPDQFGRSRTWPQPDAFSDLLETQWRLMEESADEMEIPVHHIKLHGSLYTAVEQSPRLAERYLEFLKSRSRPLVVICLSGGGFARSARAEGLPVWEELFADRALEDDGLLTPRSHPDALITDVPGAVERFRQWKQAGILHSRTGVMLERSAQTWCVHSDTPEALELATRLRQVLFEI